MNNDIKFIAQDENGIQSIAEVITCFEINGAKYVVYNIDEDLFVSKVYNNKMVRIEDIHEREKISQLIRKLMK